MRYHEITEVSMRPSTLSKTAQTANAKVGIEFEMYVPKEEADTPSFADVSDIVDFFGEYNTFDLTDRFREYIEGDYFNFCRDEFDSKYYSISSSYMDDIDTDDKSESEIEDELRNLWLKNENPDIFEAWLEESGADNLKSYIEGIPSRFRLGTAKLPGGSRETIDAFGRHIGVEINHETSRDPSKWYAMDDSSLSSEYSGYDPVEVVSAALPWSIMKEKLTTILQYAVDNDFKSDKTTGLHCNVSVPNIQNLDYVKLVLFLGDNYILEKFLRYNNSMCGSVMDQIESIANYASEMRPMNTSIPVMLDLLKNKSQQLASKIIFEKNDDKYVSVNLHTGSNPYVEFRSPGGDWINTETNELISTIDRFVVALQIACDPNAYKNEYYKKMYKLLQPTNNKNSTKSLVAKYQIGDMSASEVKQTIGDQEATRKRGTAQWNLYQQTVNGEDMSDAKPIASFTGSSFNDIKPQAQSWVLRKFGKVRDPYLSLLIRDPFTKQMQPLSMTLHGGR